MAAFTEDFIGDLTPFPAVFTPGGKTPGAGEIVRNEDLATTHERIAKGGRTAFYEGEIAKRVDAAMRAMGGPLRLADFKAHTGDWVEPVRTRYRGFDVHELPMNMSGIPALQILNILEGFDCASWYKNADGKITQNWSDHTRAHASATAEVKLEDYDIVR
ncbi:MAG: gamma-glutamyltransferase [Alphaproteobacteria bacterium]